MKNTSMSNTYKQSAVHVIFAPKYRRALLHSSIRERVEKYMTGKINGLGHELIAIYAMPDHVHVLMAISMNMAPAMILQVLKAETSKWINEQRLLPERFEWQRGYGWFHISGDRIETVSRYIRRQPEHHKKESFMMEATRLMKENGVDYDPRYGFTDPV
jgi:putative transposase